MSKSSVGFGFPTLVQPLCRWLLIGYIVSQVYNVTNEVACMSEGCSWHVVWLWFSVKLVQFSGVG